MTSFPPLSLWGIAIFIHFQSVRSESSLQSLEAIPWFGKQQKAITFLKKKGTPFPTIFSISNNYEKILLASFRGGGDGSSNSNVDDDFLNKNKKERRDTLESQIKLAKEYLISGSSSSSSSSKDDQQKETILEEASSSSILSEETGRTLKNDDNKEAIKEALRLFHLVVSDIEDNDNDNDDDNYSNKDLLVECYQKLGECYMVGLGGIEEDKEKAMKYWTLAGNEGYIPAQLCLGRCYMDGIGKSEPNPKEAIRWYTLAAGVSGPSEAQDETKERTGTTFADNTDDVDVSVYRSAAQLLLGKIYAEGKIIEQNTEKAIELWELAGDVNNNTEAQNKLAYAYFYGQSGHLEQNYTKAVYWLRRLINTIEEEEEVEKNQRTKATTTSPTFTSDNVNSDDNKSTKINKKKAWAMNNLAMCLVQGLGVDEPDSKEAYRLFRLLADADDTDYVAHGNVGCCYLHGEGVTQNSTIAVQYLQYAANGGSDDAQFNLGNCFATGDGIDNGEVDMDKATYWWNEAAKQGNVDAKLQLQQQQQQQQQNQE